MPSLLERFKAQSYSNPKLKTHVPESDELIQSLTHEPWLELAKTNVGQAGPTLGIYMPWIITQ